MPTDSWFRSLRFRLTFWNSLVLLVLVGLTLLGLRAGMSLALEHELDLLIKEDARETAMFLERFYATPDAITEELRRKSLSHEERGWFGQIIGSKGEVLFRTPSTPVAFPQEALNTQRPVSFERFRVVEVTTEKLGQGMGHVVVGSSIDFIQGDMDQFDELILVAWLLMVIIAPGTGYWLAGRATRPLGEILRTAERLQPKRLSERLTLSGAGDELDKLCFVINGLLDRLATYFERQKTFLANAAHELRSPMAAIRAGVEVALQRDRTAAEYREILEETAEECQNLSMLVNQLLLLAETDGRQWDAVTPPIRLDELARQTVSMFQGVAEQNQIELIADLLPVSVGVNIHHLRPILNNLLDNALKYSNPGDTVRFNVGVDPHCDSLALLTIKDTGPGIPPEEIPKLFDRFYRTDIARSKDGNRTGTGLGLSICKSLVEGHDGTITIESELGKGTRVFVRLRLASKGK